MAMAVNLAFLVPQAMMNGFTKLIFCASSRDRIASAGTSRHTGQRSAKTHDLAQLAQKHFRGFSSLRGTSRPPGSDQYVWVRC